MNISIFHPPPVPINEAKRDAAVSASGALEALDDPVLGRLAEGVCRSLDVSASLLSILHRDTQYVIAAHGIATGAYRRKNSFSGHAIASGHDVFFVPDLLADDRFADNPWVNGDIARFRFYVAAIIRPDGEHAIGTISAVDPTARTTLAPHARNVMVSASSAVTERLQQLQLRSPSADD